MESLLQEIPSKSPLERLLFEKYKSWLHSDYIPIDVIREYKSDLKILKKVKNAN